MNEPIVDVDGVVTWKDLKDFLLTKDDKFLSNQVKCFDAYCDCEVPVVSILNDSLIVNS